jgi:hypothetical protein
MLLENVKFDTTGSTLHLENVRFLARKIILAKKIYGTKSPSKNKFSNKDYRSINCIDCISFEIEDSII